MSLGVRLRAGLVRVTALRYRRILIASVVTLGVSVTLLALIGFIHWRGHQALQNDTHTAIAQTGEQLVRALQSRRGTLTFIRDTLNRQSDLTPSQLQAMGASAVQHTRHLLATGLIQASQRPIWWSGPHDLSRAEFAQLNRAIINRTGVRGMWSAPSTFVTTTRTQRPLLVMMEPLRAAAVPQSAVVGVFDVKPFLEDFVRSSVSPRMPLQLLDGETLVYRSTNWQPATPAHRPIILEQPVVLDATRWTIQMQPGSTRVVQTLSWFNVILIALSVIAGLGVTAIVWILAARTWLLQRLVARRTAALRRTSRRLRQMAITDELTGLYNRRFFLDRWGWEYERAKRYQRPLVCLMVDINGFKQVNDTLGHAAGDLVLKQVAQELKTTLRQSDILARFGGDEFIIALPETSLAQAELVAEKLRQVRVTVPDGPRHGVPTVNLSVGIGRVTEEEDSPEEILEAADQSLYEWKRRSKTVSTA